ncbi:polycomb protein Sfmbt isoform X2 [Hyalella azteca]|uniref:Polycomb protein Sfmbt isoform X2 n=1 Tax=Hyalella azteca TaxID=294128 RepID=A0A8B7PH02_HYAAZ|nr:polycomb protein Sfmbt isoform X2 [Hyalella azteca]
MASQDDLGLLWYGVAGVPFNTADPADVLLNSGTAPPPLLSDHPRPLLAQHPHLSNTPQLHTLSTPQPQPPQQTHHTITTSQHFLHPTITTPAYADPSPMLQTHHTQMLYDASTGDYITPPDYMYETLENYDDDSSGGQSMLPSGQHDPNTPSEHASHQSGFQNNYMDEESDPLPVPKTKKPKVHHHPALKLKTPIAYQKDTDLNAIPIMREGMAVCEKCGAIGVKHAFYGKERKYCSLACARPALQISGSASKNSPELSTNDDSTDNAPDNVDNDETNDSISASNGQNIAGGDSSSSSDCKASLQQQSSFSINEDTSNSGECDSPAPSTTDTDTTGSQHYEAAKSYDWTTTYLKKPDFRAVPVKCFPHAPMSECWEQMGVGMKVEVACGSEGVTKDAYWIATVMGIAGYKACLRFEGFVENSSCDFWVDLCSEEVHPVGWCASQGKPLIPPRSIQDKYSDWKQFLMKRLTGARTLPSNFHSKVMDSHKSRFKVGLNVEVVDKNRIAQMRVASVTEVVGKRLHLRYHGAPPHDNGFWCHEDAPIIHPIGWSRDVGHEIVASQSYHDKCISGEYEKTDAPPHLFVQPPVPAYVRNGDSSNAGFAKGMKLEAIDPLNLASICVATVMKVLRDHYLMIRIDSYENDDTGSDWFCYHATSPCIFPAGFCQINKIKLSPPKGYEGDFSWYNYLKTTEATAAPPALFNRDIGRCGFEVDMHLEATDLMDPRLVCVATVKAVHGRLLQIHFDGWESDFDQWIDCHSTDIYPVGWCQMVSYRLEGPPHAAHAGASGPRRRSKTRGGGRRRRGGGSASVAPPAPANVARRGRVGKESVRIKDCVRDVLSNIPSEGTQLGRQSSEAFSNEFNTRGVASRGRGNRGRRGRPRKFRAASDATQDSSLGVGNSSSDDILSSENHMSVDRYLEDELSIEHTADTENMDDHSDEDTSSGVASLADSDGCSLDDWASDASHFKQGQQVALNGTDGGCSLTTPTPSVIEQQQLLQQVPGGNDLKDSFGAGQQQQLPAALLPAEPSLDLFASDSFPSSGLQDSLCSDQYLQHQLQTTEASICTPTSVWNQNVTLAPAGQTTFINGQTAGTLLPNSTFQTLALTSPELNDTFGPTALVAMTMPPNVGSQQLQLTQLPIHLASNLNTGTMNFGLTAVPMVASDQLLLLQQQQEQQPLYIPRLIDGPIKDGSKVQPKLWTCTDVVAFLEKNDCSAYSSNFQQEGIDGPSLLALNQTPGRVMELTGMKVGPSLKIQDLIKQLVALVSPAQARYQATLLKRGLTFQRAP